MFKRFVDGVEVTVAVATLATVILLFTVAPTVPRDTSPDSQAGAELFQARCSACHGPDGGGGSGPALAGADALSRFAAPEELIRFVSTGVPGAMPGFETRLSPDEIEMVARFVWYELADRS
jgi:cytochrome c oxidase cbb3-type subunit 3